MSSHPSLAAGEREALAAAFARTSPDAPTLCAGWTAKDLLVHLVVREYRPDAILGLFLSPLKARLQEVTRQVEQLEYPALIERFRSGPPRWNPLRYADRFANLAENFVHHEDLRRGGGEVEPRQLPEWAQRELWSVVAKLAPLFLGGSSGALRLNSASYGYVRAGKASGPRVQISGSPGELLLWLFGRDSAAQVQLSGPEGVDVHSLIRRKKL